MLAQVGFNNHECRLPSAVCRMPMSLTDKGWQTSWFKLVRFASLQLSGTGYWASWQVNLPGYLDTSKHRGSRRRGWPDPATP